MSGDEEWSNNKIARNALFFVGSLIAVISAIVGIFTSSTASIAVKLLQVGLMFVAIAVLSWVIEGLRNWARNG